jgi:hypothetical protein
MPCHPAGFKVSRVPDMTPWHPIFAYLLRPSVEKHYEVQTNMPVGDVPRQADIVLLRRTDTGPLTFKGLWRQLTTWSVMEFKGPTVSARVRDLDRLVEVGLGIDRWLNEERAKRKEKPLPPEEVSFWYVTNHLGKRFLRDARLRLGELTAERPGVWRCVLLQRPVFLVSSVALPVEEDTLPMHVLADSPDEVERQVTEFVIDRPSLWKRYGPTLSLLHAETLEEVAAMGKAMKKKMTLDWARLFDIAEEEEVIQAFFKAVGVKRVLELLPPEQVVKTLGVDWLVAGLSPAMRKELKERLGCGGNAGRADALRQRRLRRERPATTQPPPQVCRVRTRRGAAGSPQA